MLGPRIALLACLLMPGVAQARGVGVLPVVGPEVVAKRVSAAIEKALGQHGGVEVFAADTFSGITASQLASLQQKAAELGVDLVIAAEVTKKGRRWQADIRILDAATTQTLRQWKPKAKRSKRLAYLIESGLSTRVVPFLAGTATPRTVSVLSVKGIRARSAELALATQPSLKVMPLRVAVKLAPGADLETAEGRVELARRAGLDALLDVQVEGRKLKKARIVIIAPGSGTVAGQAEGANKSSKRAVQAALPQLIEVLDSLGNKATKPAAAAPPVEPVGPVEPPPPAPVAAAPAAALTDPNPDKVAMSAPKSTPVKLPGSVRAWEVRVESGIAGRTLSYNDDLFGALAPYDLPAGPQIGGRFRIYPGAWLTRGFAKNLGLGFMGHAIVGVTTKDPMGRESATTAFDLAGELRFRLPLGRHEISLVGGMGHDSYTLDSIAPFEVPKTQYTYGRLGLEGAARISALEIELQGGWRPVLSMGQVNDANWFPNASVLAFDAGLSALWQFDLGLQVGLRADMRRYAFDFKPEVGDPRIAGGAVDQRWSGGLIVGWVGDGS